jgi:hypothetical protein
MELNNLKTCINFKTKQRNVSWFKQSTIFFLKKRKIKVGILDLVKHKRAKPKRKTLRHFDAPCREGWLVVGFVGVLV